jgi:hypothetical protein
MLDSITPSLSTRKTGSALGRRPIFSARTPWYCSAPAGVAGRDCVGHRSQLAPPGVSIRSRRRRRERPVGPGRAVLAGGKRRRGEKYICLFGAKIPVNEDESNEKDACPLVRSLALVNQAILQREHSEEQVAIGAYHGTGLSSAGEPLAVDFEFGISGSRAPARSDYPAIDDGLQHRPGRLDPARPIGRGRNTCRDSPTRTGNRARSPCEMTWSRSCLATSGPLASLRASLPHGDDQRQRKIMRNIMDPISIPATMMDHHHIA